MVKISVSDDGRHAILHPTTDAGTGTETGPQDPVTLDADQVSALIDALARARAQMKPGISGRFAPGKSPAHTCDNLLWETAPDPSRRAVTLGLHHEGLGWISVKLSRAQIEDLVTSIAFAVAEMDNSPGIQNQRQGPNPPAAAAEPVPIRRTERGPARRARG